MMSWGCLRSVWKGETPLTSLCSTLLDSFPPDSWMTLRISSSSFSAFAASSFESFSCLQLKHNFKKKRLQMRHCGHEQIKVFTLQHAAGEEQSISVHQMSARKNPSGPLCLIHTFLFCAAEGKTVFEWQKENSKGLSPLPSAVSHDWL